MLSCQWDGAYKGLAHEVMAAGFPISGILNHNFFTSLYMYISFFLSLALSPSLSLSLFLSVCVCVCVYVCLSVGISVSFLCLISYC